MPSDPTVETPVTDLEWLLGRVLNDGEYADDTKRLTAPVFAVGHEVGNHYWLDTKSDPPTYHWDGTRRHANAEE
jgi:hypothetical protein